MLHSIRMRYVYLTYTLLLKHIRLGNNTYVTEPKLLTTLSDRKQPTQPTRRDTQV